MVTHYPNGVFVFLFGWLGGIGHTNIETDTDTNGDSDGDGQNDHFLRHEKTSYETSLLFVFHISNIASFQ